MKIATWNINSIKIRLNSLIQLLKENDLDYICLQETKIKDEYFPKDEMEKLKYKSYYSGEGGKNGVSIISKKEGNFEKIGFLDGEEDLERRLISVKFEDLYIISVYVPLGGARGTERYYYKLRFFDRLKRYFNRFYKKDEKIILCGDFNISLEDIDVYNPDEMGEEVGFLKEEKEKLKELLSFGFYDSFRLLNPNKKEFSWWDYRWNSYEKNIGMRLDYIFITEPLIKNLDEVVLLKKYREIEKPSDHIPVILTLK
ncbi:MAG: exodeoxyribonuclease III [Caldisericia bacterium]